MRKKTVWISKNTQETAKIAKIFLNEILKKNSKNDGALVVGLSGDLGAGKTTFTQAIARHLNIKNKVNSPTFVIIKKYRIKKPNKYKFLFHLDAYRLKNEKELLHLGWEDIIGNKEHLVLIEWPENVSKIIPPDARSVFISHKKEKHRHFKITR